MSEFSVPVVRITEINKHDNADSLSWTTVEGCPVIFKTTDFKLNDLAIYIPIESVVPNDNPHFAFLSKTRIKAVRLRGMFSMGLLMPTSILNREATEGEDVAQELGIVKWEESVPVHYKGQQSTPPPVPVPVYDIESHRKYKKLYKENECVVVTEKLHGTSARFLVDSEGQLWVGSRNVWLKMDETNLYWSIAIKYGLAEKLKNYPNYAFFGEVYGNGVQDLTYGAKPGERFLAIFDILDTKTQKYLDFADMTKICSELDLPTVPLLYIGEVDDKFLNELCEGKCSFADNIREGIVIKPLNERVDVRHGRVITKLVGQGYLLRKNGTECH